MDRMTQLQIRKDVINNLKGLKITLGLTTYNDVIEELIRLSYLKENTKGISNKDLLETLGKGQKHLTKRLEALHTRIGYYEKDYFLKIQDIYDAVDNIKLSSNEVSKKEKNENVISIGSNLVDEKIYKKQIEDLKESHSEIENVNQKLNHKVNLLENKFVKKSGVFAQGYECILTDEEYLKIFS